MTAPHTSRPGPSSPAPLPNDASVLVVGAGLAGLRTASLLREHGHAGPVHLVGDEPHAPYDRPPLSKHLLDDGWHVDLGADLGIDLGALDVDVHLGTRVTRIDVDGQRFRAELVTARPSAGLAGRTAVSDVQASDTADEQAGSDVLVADAVVLATGSRATRVPGWEHALTLHSHDDAVRLRTLLAAGSRPRLVCIGAGWIGSEVAGVAAAAGADVTVVELARAPLASALGDDGELVAPWFDAAGVTFLPGMRVMSVEPDGVVLADGRRVDADVVLAAVGARPAPLPDGSLAALLHARPGEGVAVDGSMRPVGGSATSSVDALGAAAVLARVRVVGDAATRASARDGIVAGGHWDAALTTPDLAVRSLLDPAADLADPAPYVFSTMLGHEVAMYGTRPSAARLVLRGDPAGDDGWAALWFVDAEQSGGAPGASGGLGASGSSGASGGLGASDAPGASGASGDLGASGVSGAELSDAGASSASGDGLRTLAGILVVDRPRDVAAARRLFRAPSLPRLDPARAADPSAPLR